MELMAPGFVVFFFGLSACTVGICRFALGEAFTPVWQISAFSVFSVLYIVILRRLIKSVFVGEKSVGGERLSDGGLAGRLGRVTEQIREGIAEYACISYTFDKAPLFEIRKGDLS
jgi:membrane protein implicated in regulation of membrane protease activity